MENERRYAIKSVKTLEEAYQKYGKERLKHTLLNSVFAMTTIISATASSFDNPVVETLALGNLALLAVNTIKILNTSKNIKRTSNSLNEEYDELNIPEEESIIDLKIVRQEGNELVEFFDFELLTKLVCLFDSQNKMNSEIN